MNIWNKVFIVLIVLFGIAAILWTTKEIKVQSKWRSEIQNKTTKLIETQKNIEKMLLSAKPTEEISGRTPGDLVGSELEVKLNLLLKERDRAWFGCTPVSVAPGKKGVNPSLAGLANQTPLRLATVELITSEPLDVKGIVYLFDEGALKAGGAAGSGDDTGTNADGRRSVFLGRFSIDGAPKAGPPQDPNDPASPRSYTSSLTSIDLLTPDEEALLQNAQRTRGAKWAVYMTMPVDRLYELYSTKSPSPYAPDGNVAHDPYTLGAGGANTTDANAAEENATEENPAGETRTAAVGETPPLLFGQMNQATRDALPDDVRDFLFDESMSPRVQTPRGLEYLITAAYQQRILLAQTIDTLNRNIRDLDDAKKRLDDELAKSRDDQKLEQERIDAMKAQYASVEKLYSDISTLAQGLTKELKESQEENEELVKRIETSQRNAAASIQERRQ